MVPRSASRRGLPRLLRQAWSWHDARRRPSRWPQEFMESVLVPQVMLYGFLGLTQEPTGFAIAPSTAERLGILTVRFDTFRHPSSTTEIERENLKGSSATFAFHRASLLQNAVASSRRQLEKRIGTYQTQWILRGFGLAKQRIKMAKRSVFGRINGRPTNVPNSPSKLLSTYPSTGIWC